MPGVICVFDSFGDLDTGAKNWRPDAGIDRCQPVARLRIDFADDNPRRSAEISDRRSFARKFRIIGQSKALAGCTSGRVLQQFRNAVTRRTGNDSRANDNRMKCLFSGDRFADRLNDAFDSRDILRTVSIAQRGDTDKGHIRVRYSSLQIGCPAQPAAAPDRGYKLIDVRLQNWGVAAGEKIDLSLIEVDANNLMPHFTETRAGYGADKS